MEADTKISYILTTYNKYDYLKITLPYIVSMLLPDEELIIIDGNSNDNTVTFTKALIEGKTNIYFKSEKDKGEADGLNKALALCKGKLIKNLTDDDAFSFYAVRKAAEHMLYHNIDIMGFDGFGISLHIDDYKFSKTDFTSKFKNYMSNKTPFFFCGLSYLINRKALHELGFFSIDHKMVDLEYSFRVSAGKCKIGWSNLLMFVNIYNANSNTLLLNKTLEKESIHLHKKYRPASEWLKVYFRFKLQRILEFKNRLLKKETFGKTNKLNFEESFKRSVLLLEKENMLLEEIIFYP